LNPLIRIFESPSGLAESFATEFSEKIKQFLEDKSTINIALSGGSTPKLFFQVLSEKYKKKINWQKVNLYWADERCVPPDSPDSNYGMTKEFLLDNISIPSLNIHRIMGENNPEEEAERYADEIEKNVEFRNGLPAFDIILLGIGEDGHTASIFPNQIELMNSEKICAVSVHPVTHQKRITLTGKVINNASYIAFLVSGESKSQVVADIINHSAESEKYPASKISPVNGELIWFLDKEAAK
jgi:6-phosphogluconolactonase